MNGLMLVVVCSKEVATYTVWSFVGDVVQNVSNLTSPTFKKVKGKAYHRGMNSEWINVSCGW